MVTYILNGYQPPADFNTPLYKSYLDTVALLSDFFYSHGTNHEEMKAQL